MGRIKNTAKNAALKCVNPVRDIKDSIWKRSISNGVKAACGITGWTIGVTAWGVRGASGLTKRVVRAAFRTFPGRGKKEHPAESKEATVQSQKETVSFAEKSLLKSIGPEHIKEEPKVEMGFYENTLLTQTIRDISDEQPSKRYNAVMTLGSIAAKLGTEAVIGPLVKAMKDQNGNIRSQACKVLVDLEAASVINEITLLLKDKNPRARLEALRGVYKLSTDSSSVLCHLIDAAREQHREIRKRAATYLGWIESDEAVSALIDLMSDKESIVRKTAVLAIGELRDRKAIMPLINLLDDKNNEVREVAVYTLRILTNQNFGYDFKSEVEERKATVGKWNKWWEVNRLIFTIYKKEFVVPEVPTIEELEKSREEEKALRQAQDASKDAERSRSANQEAKKKETAEKAKKEQEAQEQAKKEAEEKAKKEQEEKANQEAKKKETAEKAKKEQEAQEQAKKEAEEKALRQAQDASKDAERSRSAKEKPATPKGVAFPMSEKIARLRKADREKLKKKLGTRLKSIREKLEKRKVGEDGRQKEFDDLKAKMKDLEQMLLLKEKKKLSD